MAGYGSQLGQGRRKHRTDGKNKSEGKTAKLSLETIDRHILSSETGTFSGTGEIMVEFLEPMPIGIRSGAKQSRIYRQTTG